MCQPRKKNSPATYITKFFERYFPISVLVCVEYCLVDDLLELLVREIVPDHRLQDLKQFSIADESVLINVVDAEGN